MNRRKLFGLLAAAQVAAAAKQYTHESNPCLDIPLPESRSCIIGRPKCYSDVNYRDAFCVFVNEYRRKKHGLPTGCIVLGDVSSSHDEYLNEETPSSRWTALPGFTSAEEMHKAFADACFNGEIPGVWWE